MTITVIRHTGVVGVGTGGAIAINLNGEKVATVNPEQQIQVDIPEKTATLQVSQWGARSKPIEVQNGEIIEITNRKWTNRIYFSSIILFSILLNVISSYSSTVQYRYTAITILVAVYLFTMFQINWYHLKKI